MEKFNLVRGIGVFISGIICCSSAYIMGHTAAMHQHASLDEQDKMLLDKDGNVNKRAYIKKAFVDYVKMQRDPLGLNRELE